jgi:hypothetical protein
VGRIARALEPLECKRLRTIDRRKLIDDENMSADTSGHGQAPRSPVPAHPRDAASEGTSEAATVEFLRNLNETRGVTMLIVTHLLPIVLNLATSIMLLGTNTILHGTVDEVLQEERLSKLYGVPVHLGVVAGQRTLVVGRRGGVDV